jgi:lipopolysaccharide assembly protein A
MQFLKTLFWIAVAVVLAIFTTNNWFAVPIRLWDQLIVDIKLPVLVFGAFLLGLAPVLAVHRATRWHFRRKLAEKDRALADAQAHAPPIFIDPAVEALPAAPPSDAPFPDRP